MKILILAGGKGTRLQSEEYNLPKALRKLSNKTLISYVIDGLSTSDDICIVVGYMREKITASLGDKYCYAVQEKQLGTGHAVMCATDFLKEYDGKVLVTFGDMPLLLKTTYKGIMDYSIETNSACTMLTANIENNDLPYGRVIRDNDNNLVTIVEDKDCNEEQRKIEELFTGVMVFDSKILLNSLDKISNNNIQNEYYLTDLPAAILAQGFKVNTYTINDRTQILGINTIDDLEAAEKILAVRKQKEGELND